MTIGSIVTMARMFMNFTQNWYNAVWSLTIASIALIYLWNLYAIKRNDKENNSSNKNATLKNKNNNIDKVDPEEQISFIDTNLFKQ